MNPKVFIFIGRSGCGKGTQSKLIVEHLKRVDPERSSLYIQTGAEFREFIKGNSKTQELSRAIYDVGGIQPEFLAVYVWTNVLVQKYSGNDHLVFDGASRRFHEAGVVDSVFDFYGIDTVNVVNIEISEKESIRRLMKRGRVDDNEEDIAQRLSWYDAEVGPAIEFFRNNPRYNLLTINGEQSIEKIHETIVSSYK